MTIDVEHIQMSFGKNHVLKDVSLQAEHGEVLGLIGPSGAGKSILIRLITGALHADSGTIKFDDVVVPDKRLLKTIGFMPQSDALYPDLSGLDNLKFFGRLYGLDEKSLNRRCDELLSFIGLFEDRHKLVINYSGGMKKRLSLIMALIHDPSVLILDEPTVGIDPILRRTIWDEFITLANAGKTLIISTNVMAEAVKCTKCALIHDGSLIAFDTVDALLKSTSSGVLEDLFLRDEGRLG